MDPELQRFIDARIEQALANHTPPANENTLRTTRVYREATINPHTALTAGGVGIPTYDALMNVDQLGAWRSDLNSVLTVPYSGWFTAGGGVAFQPISNWSAAQVAFHILGTVPGFAQAVLAGLVYPSVVANAYAMNAALTAPTYLLGGTTISAQVIGPAAGTWALLGRAAGSGFMTTLWLSAHTNPLNYQEALA